MKKENALSDANETQLSLSLFFSSVIGNDKYSSTIERMLLIELPDSSQMKIKVHITHQMQTSLLMTSAKSR